MKKCLSNKMAAPDVPTSFWTTVKKKRVSKKLIFIKSITSICCPAILSVYKLHDFLLLLCVYVRYFVSLCFVTLFSPQYLELLRSVQNRPAKCLTIMWALGQAGFYDLSQGLRGTNLTFKCLLTFMPSKIFTLFFHIF